MAKKKNNKIRDILIVIAILLLFWKGCEVDELQFSEEELSKAARVGIGGRISHLSFTNLSIFVDFVPDWDCIDDCEEEGEICYDDCDTLYCDEYYGCITDCQEPPEACWERSNCRDEAMGEYLGCGLDCVFAYADDIEVCDEVFFAPVSLPEFFELIPSVYAIPEDLGECYDDAEMEQGWCEGTCWTIYLIEYQDCYDEFQPECMECLNECYDLPIAEDCATCSDACDDEVMDCIDPDCILDEGEVVIWDGTPIDNLGEWFESGFPIFHTEFEDLCNGDYYEGTFVSTEDTMGCTDADLFYYEDCDEMPILSTAAVCDTIGGTWTCYAECDSAECDEPNAVLICEI